MGGRTRTATVLFTDLVGSTEQRTRLGDDAADALRRLLDDAAAALVSANHGEVIKSTGDGVMAAFESASEAVAAAVGIQQTLVEHNRSATEPIRVRIGIGAGDVGVDGGDLFGMPVVEAARLCDQADAGQIFVSDLVRLLSGSRGGFEFAPVGERLLKGIDGLVAVYEVAWTPVEAGVLPLPAPLRSPADDLFVGRESEIALLLDAWDDTRTAGPAAVVVAGEPGIGKTSLASFVASQAARDGALVMYGRCEDGMGVAYQPIAEAIRRLLTDHPGSAGAAYIAEHAEDLAPLLPGLVPARSDGAADAEQARWRLFETVRRTLEVACDERPLMIVIDDLHWATESTVLLIRHVLASADHGRMLALLMYRDTEDNAVLTDLLSDLARRGASRCELGGLDASAIKTLTGGAGLLDVDAVRASTKGNPFFVRQLAHIAEDAALRPTAVRDVVMSRVRRLGDDAVDALTIASVIGAQFELSLLEAVAGRDLLDVAERCEAAGLVSEVGDSPAHYRFEHDLVRHTLNEELSTARRSRLDAQIADGLESLGPPISTPARLASHLIRAATPGQASRAVTAALAAVHDLRRRFVDDEAVALGDSAADYADRDGSVPPALLGQLCVELAYCHLANSRTAEERARALQAARLATEAEDNELLAHAAMLASIEGETGRSVDEVVGLCRFTLDRIDDPVWRARVMASLAQHLAMSGDVVSAEGYARPAYELADRSEDPLAIALAGSAVVITETAGADLVELTKISSRVIRALESAGARDVVSSNLLFPHFELVQGDRRAIREERLRLETQAPTTRVLMDRLQLDNLQSLLDGAFEEALAGAARYGEIGQAHLNASLSAGAQFFAATRELGDEATVVDVLASLVEEHPVIAAYRAGWALYLAEAGDVDGARTAFGPLKVDDFALIKSFYLQPGTLALAADVCATIADRDAAPALLRLLEPHKGKILVLGSAVWAIGAADRFRAMLLALLDDDAFDEAYDAALALERKLDAPPLQARTLAAWARDLSRRDRPGDADRSADLVASARAIAKDLKMAGLLRKLDTQIG